jgi:hypothetical protein
MYPALKKWFDMPIPEKEYKNRHPSADLQCLTPGMRLRPLHELAGEIGVKRVKDSMDFVHSARPHPADTLAAKWGQLLGDIDPAKVDKASWETHPPLTLDKVTGLRVTVHVPREGGKVDIAVPVLVLMPARQEKTKLPVLRPGFPVVVAVSQEGQQGFLKQRAETIAALLDRGVAVCLPDLRGTGQTSPGSDRGRNSSATSLSASELRFGQTMLGSRLRDLRSVLSWLRRLVDVDAKNIALWGDSFAPVNSPDRNLVVPLDADKMPDQAEPLGGLLALLTPLYERDIRAVYVRGGLSSYQSVLQSPFVYLPHDAIVPGALTASDLADIASVQVPRPLRLEGLVDGLNRRVPAADLTKTYAPARAAYQRVDDRLILQAEPASPAQVADWLVSHLRDAKK